MWKTTFLSLSLLCISYQLFSQVRLKNEDVISRQPNSDIDQPAHYEYTGQTAMNIGKNRLSRVPIAGSRMGNETLLFSSDTMESNGSVMMIAATCAPSVGVNTFPGLAPSTSLDPYGALPKSATHDCWDFSITGTGNGSITHVGNVPETRVVMFSEQTNTITIKSNDGSEFDLNSYVSQWFNFSGNYTVTGYRDGTTVATGTGNASTSYTTTDLSGNNDFNNIDEFRFTGFGGSNTTLNIDAITIATATPEATPCGTNFTVDFESESWTNNQNIGSSISSKGMVLSYFSSGSTPKTMLATVGTSGPQGNVGLAVNNVGGNGDTFEIKSFDGCDFDFKSFYTYTNFVSTITITGYRDNSQVVQSANFALQPNGTNNVSSVLAGFQNVDRVVLSSPNSGGFGFFNGFDDLSIGPAVASDATPPVFESSTPSSSSITQTGFTLATDIDEAGTIYYVVVPDGAGIPTAANVKAGQASGGGSAVTSGNASVSSAGFSNNFTVTGLSAATSYDVYVVAEDDEGTPNLQASATRIDATTLAPNSLMVAATVFLEGAYNGTSMNTTINGSIPTTQPYSINGHSGGSAGSIPAGAVDWVLVELREAGSAAAALNATKKGSTAGFLMSDGTIKATDGTSNLTVSLSGNSGTDYFVVIYHRNHLPIMSASAVAGSSGTLAIDFTGNSANTHQTTTALVSIAGGKFAMPAGDADGDGDVDATDLATWQGQNGVVFSYNSTNGDFNLDGEINAVDRNDFQQKNTSKTRQVPTT
ncbi:MAG: hypothetical protein HEP71_33620 [Roseivirga sp.]|nr:hypothetical protein [Roseivirga sp.]